MQSPGNVVVVHGWEGVSSWAGLVVHQVGCATDEGDMHMEINRGG